MTEDYQPVRTEDGFEIRGPSGNVVYSTSGNWQYPPDADAMEAVFDHENVSAGMRRVLRLMIGAPDIKNERSDPDQ